MNKSVISAVTLTASLLFSASVFAQTMTKSDYKMAKDKIAADYKAAKVGCATFSGNAKDICVVEAKGREKVSKADLEAAYKPTLKNQYQARLTKAEATYAVENERCDDLGGNAKDVCRKEAKAHAVAGKADAKAQMKVSDARAKANEKSMEAQNKAKVETAEAQNKAKVETAEARKDAAVEKSDAQYAVAKERCDALAGGAKDSCLIEAKARFGKQ